MSNLEQLHSALGDYPRLAIAVSGGVDSMTLAHAAHRLATVHGSGIEVEMFHAVSAAVPESATVRVREHAADHGWRLSVIDAGEMDDPAYRANPVDRCFHCKRNLYGSIAAHTDARVASGTNTDDLDDYRPGLVAAADAAVVHPFVDAGIDKAGVRALADSFGLHDLAELPSAPCLSSRVETGTAIDPAWLATIDAVEIAVRSELPGATVRCRVRGDRIAVELDRDALGRLDDHDRDRLVDLVTAHWAGHDLRRSVVIEPYQRGSAFLTVDYMIDGPVLGP